MDALKKILLAALLAFAPVASWACSGPDCAGTLAYEAFGDVKSPKSLVVFLHGSVSAGGPADYMYGPARRFAEAHPDVVAVALLAPGYYDRKGKRSAGSDAGRRLSDDTDEIIPALEELRRRYKPRKMFVFGHSKGAMNMGGVLAKKPGLADGAVLLAGIYDIPALAEYRRRAQNGVSTIDMVNRIPKSARIVLVHGDVDKDVPLSQSVDFEKKAKAAGVQVRLIALEGVGHDFNGPLSATGIDALDALVR